jgi:hypothetical protein
MRKRLTVATATLAVAGVLGASTPAKAQTVPQACNAYPNPVYISGSSASQPVLQTLAAILGTSVSIIYYKPDSCYGLNDTINPAPSTEGSNIGPFYLNPGGTADACAIDMEAGATVPVPDIGVSDVFLQTCEDALNIGVPAGAKLAEVQGPIQAMTFAVPSASSATAISAEAAYVVFGYDATTYAVPQWNVPANIFVRPKSSGTLNMIGKAIGLDPSKWKNADLVATPPAQQQAGTGNMVTAVSGASSNQDATIGILSYEALQQANAKAVATGGTGLTMKILPYQKAGATCGFLPDSSTAHADRLSVRQGDYDIWGPLHFIVNVDASGYPKPNNAATSADAMATILNYFIQTGPASTVSQMDAEAPLVVTPFTAADAGADAGGGISAAHLQQLITAEATVSQGGVVPWCAMQVIRAAEIGAPASYQADTPCGCFFEKTAAGATVSPYCQTCSSDADCAAAGACNPKCRFGYCEAK